MLPPTMLARMNRLEARDVDCGTCASSRRCWPDGAMPNAGFTVRRRRPLEPGEILFREGADFDAPYLVTSGCLIVTELLADGEERIVAFRVRGEILGLESWNLDSRRFGARALVASTVCRLRWGPSGATARSAPLLRALLAKATAQSSDVSMPWPGLSAVDRVRAFVTDFRARSDQPLPMTRAQIGQYLGLAEETVVRAFKAIERRA